MTSSSPSVIVILITSLSDIVILITRVSLYSIVIFITSSSISIIVILFTSSSFSTIVSVITCSRRTICEMVFGLWVILGKRVLKEEIIRTLSHKVIEFPRRFMHELKCCKVKPTCRLSQRTVKKIDKIYRIYINNKVINPGVKKSDFFHTFMLFYSISFQNPCWFHQCKTMFWRLIM